MRHTSIIYGAIDRSVYRERTDKDTRSTVSVAERYAKQTRRGMRKRKAHKLCDLFDKFPRACYMSESIANLAY